MDTAQAKGTVGVMVPQAMPKVMGATVVMESMADTVEALEDINDLFAMLPQFMSTACTIPQRHIGLRVEDIIHTVTMTPYLTTLLGILITPMATRVMPAPGIITNKML